MEIRSYLGLINGPIPYARKYVLTFLQFGDNYYLNRRIEPNTEPYQSPNGFQKGFGARPRAVCGRRDLGRPIRPRNKKV